MPSFTVETSTRIQASPEKIYSVVRDFSQWRPWSPWLIAEPSCRVDVDSDGRGYRWEGKIVGAGVMKVEEEEANRSLRCRLTFLKPWKSESQVRFTFEPRDGETETTWTMSGSLPIFMFWMKSTLAAAIEQDYRRGLAMLKDYVERGEVPSELKFEGIQDWEGGRFVGLRTSCSLEELGPRMDQDFGRLREWAKESGTAPAGRSFTIYDKYDIKAGVARYTAALPAGSEVKKAPEGFVLGELPGCRVYAVTHRGPYRHLGNPWAAGMMHGRAKLFKPRKRPHPFEVYLNEPGEVSEEKLLTKVCFPAA